MRHFGSSFVKPGPGIPGDAPKKRGTALFLATLAREFGSLLRLNLLFLLCCVPVVTIPAATTAMARITLAMAGDQPYFLWQEFFAAFRREFFRSLAAGALFAAWGALSLFSGWLYLSAAATAWYYAALAALCLFSLLLCGMAAAFAFPMLAGVALPLRQVLRNAVLLALSRPLHALPAVLLPAFFLFFALQVPLLLPLLLLALSLFSLVGAFAVLPVLQQVVFRPADTAPPAP